VAGVVVAMAGDGKGNDKGNNDNEGNKGKYKKQSKKAMWYLAEAADDGLAAPGI